MANEIQNKLFVPINLCGAFHFQNGDVYKHEEVLSNYLPMDISVGTPITCAM